MKTAFSIWENRIAPVFDTAGRLLVVGPCPDGTLAESWASMPDAEPLRKVARLADLGVGELVCGAVSRPLRDLLVARGVRVVPFVAGEVREVMAAWRKGCLGGADFAMPGCCRRRRNRCGQRQPPLCGG